MTTNKPVRLPSLPEMPSNLDEPLFNLLEAMRAQLIASSGGLELRDKKPTVQDLIDAGVTNADKIK